MEAFFAWYGANPFETFQINQERPFGDYAHDYWLLILCNCVSVQFLWIPWFRTNPIALWCVAGVINIGMWLERYVIVVLSLHADFLPSSWGMYHGDVLGLCHVTTARSACSCP